MIRLPILVALCILPTGCAGMIATSGIKLDTFETIDEIHAKFGEPCMTGSAKDAFKESKPVYENAVFYEDYHTRQKIADRDWADGDGYAIGLIVTLGTAELLLFPHELFKLTKHEITGQTLRIVYDANGKVVAGQLDGENLYLHPHYHTSSKEDSPSLPPPSSIIPSRNDTLNASPQGEACDARTPSWWRFCSLCPGVRTRWWEREKTWER